MRSARTLLDEIHSLEPGEVQKDKIVILVLLCITLVEAFTNIFFVIKARDSKDQALIDQVDKDLGLNSDRGIGIKAKLDRWPPKILSKSVNWSSGYGLKFENLRSVRNSLMHFTSAHENLAAEGINFVGMSDTSVYENLNCEYADEALEIVFGFLGHLLSISGTSDKDIPHAFHSWFGIVPELT